jgi:antitoxin ParD1/3/4
MRYMCYVGASEWSLVMNVSIGQRWEEFVGSVVRDGRYGSASEVVREGLRLVEERETKLKALRKTIEASLTEGGALSQEEVTAALAVKARSLATEGF